MLSETGPRWLTPLWPLFTDWFTSIDSQSLSRFPHKANLFNCDGCTHVNIVTIIRSVISHVYTAAWLIWANLLTLTLGDCHSCLSDNVNSAFKTKLSCSRCRLVIIDKNESLWDCGNEYSVGGDKSLSKIYDCTIFNCFVCVFFFYIIHIQGYFWMQS